MEQEIISTIEFQKKYDEKSYVFILVDGKWIREHIYVVEKYIGRRLTPIEVIHHDDQNKYNNYIENLTLFPNVKSHSRFHRQIKQFGYTNPRKQEIEHLKYLMEMERIKNGKD